MPDYIHPDWLAILQGNGMATFEQLWGLQADWIESPNADRGGSSGVSRLLLQRPNGGEVAVYLKRQRSHTRRTLRHPLRGESTFSREFRMLCHLHRHGVMAPLPVYYGERVLDGEVCAVLLTEELAGYRSLEDVLADVVNGEADLSGQGWRRMCRDVAVAVRAMHACGVQHRSLYPKHVFVKDNGNGYDVAMIDLEKSRRSHWPGWRTIQDLATLNYRTSYGRRTCRLYFFKCYHAVASLNWWQRRQCRTIARRSASRLQRLNKV